MGWYAHLLLRLRVVSSLLGPQGGCAHSFAQLARILMLAACSASVYALEIGGPQPLESLPPEPATVAFDPNYRGGGRATEAPQQERTVDREGLRADLEALLRVKDRVMRRIQAGEVPGQDPQQVLTELSRTGLDDEERIPVGAPAGPPIVSNHLDLLIQPLVDAEGVLGMGTATVTASIRDEPVEVVYRELIALRGLSVDDQQVTVGRRRVALHVDTLDWRETLSRVLGQTGLAWREGLDGKIVVYEIASEPPSREDLLRLAEQAFIAASSDPSDPRSAEARYLRAKQHHDAGDLAIALAAYEEVFKDVDRNSPAYAEAQEWVRRAIRGMGDVMMEMKQYRDARSVYLNYISTAPEQDQAKPDVTFQAAMAARSIGVTEDGDIVDPTALTQAEELFEQVLIYENNGSNYQAVAARARLELGHLLYAQRQYAAAKAYLQAHVKRVGTESGDRLQFLIAECDYNLAQQAQGEHRYNESARLIGHARGIYQQLFERYQSGQVDNLLANSSEIYRISAFRIGLTWQEQEQPDNVRALLAFLRARQTFHDSPLEGELLVRITRSYAELERHEHAVETLYELLKQDGVVGTDAVVDRIESLLGEIRINLANYDSGIKAKVLFYIAQRHYEMAKRDPRVHDERLGRAIYDYQRVLSEDELQPGLKIAAELGLGRSALDLGDQELGVQTLREVLIDQQATARDQALAAQLLGDYFRANGDYERALQFYTADGGEIPK